MHFTNHFESSISERKPTAVEWYEPEADGFGPSGASRSGARSPPEAAPGQTSFAAGRLGMGSAARDADGRRRPQLLASIDRTPGPGVARQAASSLGRGPRRPAAADPRAPAHGSVFPFTRSTSSSSADVWWWSGARAAAVAKQPDAPIDMAGACECGWIRGWGKKPNRAHGNASVRAPARPHHAGQRRGAEPRASRASGSPPTTHPWRPGARHKEQDAPACP